MAAQGRGCASVVALLLALLVHRSQAVQHTVGGSQGWNLQVDFDTWAAQSKLAVGDTLLFTYNAEAHIVLELSAADYQSCTLANPIKTYDDGNTVVTLSAAKSYYFVCGVPGHCTAGMKVEATVAASAAAPTASNATSPVASPPASPPPATPSPASPPPATPPPVATPPVSSPPAPASPASAPSLSPTSTPPASPPSTPPSSPTPSPATSPPTPSSSPAPSPSATPTPSPVASSVPPSGPSPTTSVAPPSPPVPTESPTPGASGSFRSVTAQAFLTIASAAFAGALLL